MQTDPQTIDQTMQQLLKLRRQLAALAAELDTIIGQLPDDPLLADDQADQVS